MKSGLEFVSSSTHKTNVKNDVMMMQLLQGKGRTGVVNFG